MVQLLILKMGSTFPDVVKQHGDYEQWFLRRCLTHIDAFPQADAEVKSPFTVTVHDMTLGTVPTSSPDLVCITGSPHSVYEELPWIPVACAYIRELTQRRIPLLGVCFGHQIVAHALGGTVQKNPRGWEIGSSRVWPTDAGKLDPLFEHFDAPLVVHESHQDVVMVPPADAIVLAESPLDRFHALRMGATTWTVQFHPEIDAEEISALLCSRESLLQAEGEDRGLIRGEFVMRAKLSIAHFSHGSQIFRQFLQAALQER